MELSTVVDTGVPASAMLLYVFSVIPEDWLCCALAAVTAYPRVRSIIISAATPASDCRLSKAIEWKNHILIFEIDRFCNNPRAPYHRSFAPPPIAQLGLAGSLVQAAAEPAAPPSHLPALGRLA